MVGSAPSFPAQPSGLAPLPPPAANALLRFAARVRLPAALKTDPPPPDDALLPLYAEALAAGTLDAATRARVCRALTIAGGNARRYVPQWVPYYVEAVCAFSDDPRCVLFVLSLLQSGAIHAEADLAFSQGVYAAALFFESWEGMAQRTAWGVPPYSELRRRLALLYVADENYFAPERTDLCEAVYADLGSRKNADEFQRDREQIAFYLAAAYQTEGRDDAFAQNIRLAVARFPQSSGYSKYDSLSDPLDDPELILRGGSGFADDDYRIARRYVSEGRDADAAACALFARCVQHAENASDEAQAQYWTTHLALALIAVGRVDEDTHEILLAATTADPNNPLLEAATVYAQVQNGASDVFSGNPEGAHRLERVVLDKGGVYRPLAGRYGWDWNILERALALSWGHRGRTDGAARGLYRQAVDANPGDKLLCVLYARALAQAQIYDKHAITAYERAVGIGKGSDAVRRALALAYVQTDAAKSPDKRDAATRLWEEMYRTGGMADDPVIVSALAEVYAEAGGDSDVAVILWEKAAKADPKNGKVRLKLAREMRGRGETEGAVRLFKEAAKLLPDDFDAQYETGKMLREQSDEGGAVRFLKKAISLPEGIAHVNAHFALSEALIATEKRDEAKLLLERVIETMNANHQPSLLSLAKINLRYEETGAKRAEVLLEKALAINPADADAHKRLATLHEEQGRLADAEAALEQYLSLSPPDMETMRRLANMYLKRGDFIKAESALRQTVALGGGDKKLFTQLGDVIQQAQKQRDGKAPVTSGNTPTPVAVPIVPATPKRTVVLAPDRKSVV